jgi:hypothetical protein
MAILLATDDVAKLFFDSAGDLAKQLIAVSTGILGLSITFLKDVVKETPKTPRWALRLSWIVYLLSVICGFWTLMAVTGSIERLLLDKNSPPIVQNIRLPAALQIVLFVLASACLVLYGIGVFQKKADPKPGIDQLAD